VRFPLHFKSFWLASDQANIKGIIVDRIVTVNL